MINSTTVAFPISFAGDSLTGDKGREITMEHFTTFVFIS